MRDHRTHVCALARPEPLTGVVGVQRQSLDIAVRVAGDEEIAQVAWLRSLWTGVDDNPMFHQRMSAWIRSEGDRRTTWLAWLGAQPAGMASVLEYRRMPRPGRPDSRWGYLSNMFVREELCSQGIGSALLAAIIATADNRAYARLVLSPSERALAFYQRAGFIVPDHSAGSDRLLVRPAANPLG